MKDLVDYLNEAIERIDKVCALSSYHFFMNRPAVFIEYWLEQIALTCDGSGLWLEWDMNLDPLAEQVYLLHFYPEVWPI